MIWVGILMAGIALAAQSFALKNSLHWQTIVFNLLCISQMAHLLAIRSQTQSLFTTGLFSNKPLLGAVLLTLVLQFLVTYTPALHPIFKTQSLTFYEFVGVGAASSLVFFGVEIEKAISRNRLAKKTA